MLLTSCMVPPELCEPAMSLLLQHADDFEPGVVHLDEFAERGIVAEQVDLGAFAEHADGGAGGVVGFVEEAAFGQMQAVDDAVGRAHAVKLRNFARGFGKHARGVEGAARGESFEIFDVGLEDADIAIGEAGRGAAALLQSSWLVAGRESIRILRTPSCSMKRSDSSRAPAPMASMPITEPTPNTMPSAVRSVRVFWARRLEKAWPKSEGGSLTFESLHGALLLGGRAWFCWSGLDMATTSPSLTPVSTAWLSLRRTSVTSCGMKPRGRLQINEGAAIAFKQRLRGHPNGVVESFRR